MVNIVSWLGAVGLWGCLQGEIVTGQPKIVEILDGEEVDGVGWNWEEDFGCVEATGTSCIAQGFIGNGEDKFVAIGGFPIRVVSNLSGSLGFNDLAVDGHMGISVDRYASKTIKVLARNENGAFLYYYDTDGSAWAQAGTTLQVKNGTQTSVASGNAESDVSVAFKDNSTNKFRIVFCNTLNRCTSFREVTLTTQLESSASLILASDSDKVFYAANVGVSIIIGTVKGNLKQVASFSPPVVIAPEIEMIVKGGGTGTTFLVTYYSQPTVESKQRVWCTIVNNGTVVDTVKGPLVEVGSRVSTELDMETLIPVFAFQDPTDGKFKIQHGETGTPVSPSDGLHSRGTIAAPCNDTRPWFDLAFLHEEKEKLHWFPFQLIVNSTGGGDDDDDDDDDDDEPVPNGSKNSDDEPPLAIYAGAGAGGFALLVGSAFIYVRYMKKKNGDPAPSVSPKPQPPGSATIVTVAPQDHASDLDQEDDMESGGVITVNAVSTLPVAELCRDDFDIKMAEPL